MVGRQHRGRRPSTTINTKTDDGFSVSWIGGSLILRGGGGVSKSNETLISGSDDPNRSSQSHHRSSQSHHHHHHHLHPRRPPLKPTTGTGTATRGKVVSRYSMDRQQLNLLRQRAIHSMAAAAAAKEKAKALPDLEEGEIPPEPPQPNPELELEELRRRALLSMRRRPPRAPAGSDLEQGEIPPEHHPSNPHILPCAPYTSTEAPPTSTLGKGMDMTQLAEVPHQPLPLHTTQPVPGNTLDLHLSSILRHLASLSMGDYYEATATAQGITFDDRFLQSLQALTI